jgi:hypothetical protein
VITVRYRGQRGNQLFQYCLGRILAEQRGYALRAAPIEGFPVTREVGEGRRVFLPWTRLSGHRIDFAAALARPGHRRYRLDGYFLAYTYYQAHADRLRAWLGPALREPCEAMKRHAPGPDDLLVMVRLGDFVRCGAALATAYFDAILAACPHRRLFITSDELDHPFLAHFDRLGAIRVRADAIDTLRLAARFPKLAISNSTFGWWAAYLGDAQEIWFPLQSHVPEGAWALNRLADGVDLRVDDPRYRYVYGAPGLTAPPAPLTLRPLAAVPAFASHASFHRQSTAYAAIAQ